MDGVKTEHVAAVREAHYSLINKTDAYCRKLRRLDLDRQGAEEYIKEIIQLLIYIPGPAKALEGLARALGEAHAKHAPGHTLSHADRLLGDLGTDEQIDQVNRVRFADDVGLPLIAKSRPARSIVVVALSAVVPVLLALLLLEAGHGFATARSTLEETSAMLKVARAPQRPHPGVVRDACVSALVAQQHTLSTSIYLPVRESIGECRNATRNICEVLSSTIADITVARLASANSLEDSCRLRWNFLW